MVIHLRKFRGKMRFQEVKTDEHCVNAECGGIGASGFYVSEDRMEEAHQR